MTPRSTLRLASLASALTLGMLTGCDVDNHSTATGTPKQAPETQSPTDPGRINAGGPGSEVKAPK